MVDSSVFVAIATLEADADALSEAMSRAGRCVMSAGNYLECAMIAESRFGGRAALDAWIQRRGIDILPVDHALARSAADAFARFGKGRHPAGLNYGDCFAYALARTLDAPLLYKGGDFARTDIATALP
ncbi:type II toxin-antitoxin system VapC family toxin [Methylobacterium oryzisoli]|uniref:type II toxin-antitoxin system VapC family toxin n=1 Tax=Methylobacterium oryzisoli TaxID=3385502 RepID=UPI0038929732